MIAYTSKKLERLLKLELIRFCIVGGTGFVINLVVLTLLHKVIGIPIFIAQVVGAETALFNNFMLHNNWTYKHKKVEKSIGSMLIQFHATTWPAILGSAVMVSLAVHFLHFSNLLALIASSAVVFAWNYTWSKFIIWRGVSPQEIEEIVA
jgi:dolichol-phosphate mannosyltransferase